MVVASLIKGAMRYNEHGHRHWLPMLQPSLHSDTFSVQHLIAALDTDSVVVFEDTVRAAFEQDPKWSERWSSAQRDIIVQEAIDKNVMDCLPVLHRYGFRLGIPDAITFRKIADKLCCGQWSYPELLCPDLFVRDGGVYFERMAQGLFRVFKKPDRGWQGIHFPDSHDGQMTCALNREHLDRMMALDLPPLDFIAEQVAEAYVFGITQQKTGWLSQVNPHWEEEVAYLLRLGWLDEARVRHCLGQNTKADPLKPLAILANARTALLEEATPVVLVKRHPLIPRL